jgi:hypothetical protein
MLLPTILMYMKYTYAAQSHVACTRQKRRCTNMHTRQKRIKHTQKKVHAYKDNMCAGDMLDTAPPNASRPALFAARQFAYINKRTTYTYQRTYILMSNVFLCRIKLSIGDRRGPCLQHQHADQIGAHHDLLTIHDRSESQFSRQYA